MTAIRANDTNSTGLPAGSPCEVVTERAALSELRPHPDNTYPMDEGAIAVLAENIAEAGLIQPIVCRRVADGGLQILSGHRRARALRLLAKSDPAWAEVDVRVYEGLSDEEALVILHSSNIARSLSDEERRRQADALQASVAALRETHPEWRGVRTDAIVASMLGMSTTTYKRKMKLARGLDPRINSYVQSGRLSAKSARAAADLPAERQAALADALDRARPRTRLDGNAVVDSFAKPLSSYVREVHAAARALDAAYFRLREAAEAQGGFGAVDLEYLRGARDWIDGVVGD